MTQQSTRALSFQREEEILLTGDSWVLSTDISLHTFYNTIGEFNKLLDDAIERDHEVRREMDPLSANYINYIVSRELNIIEHD